MLTIRLSEVDSACTAEIARAAGLTTEPKGWLSRFTRGTAGVVNVPGPQGGCGCSFLADSADWNASTWDMIPDTLPRLISIVRTVREHTVAGFSFDALWVGEAPVEERRVSFDELLQLIQQSRLATKTRYLVQHDQTT